MTPHARTSLAVSCALALAAGLVAQQPAWGIPRDGVAVYEETLRTEQDVVRSSVSPAPRPYSMIPGPRRVPVVLDTELTEDRSHLAAPPINLAELLPWLACDLRTTRRGKVSEVFDDFDDHGTVIVRGDVEAIDDTGAQEMVLELSRRVRRQGTEADRDFEHWNKTIFRHGIHGEIRLLRRFDLEQGVLRSFEATMTGEYTDPENDERQRVAFTWTQSWTLRQVRGHRDERFEADVREAIDRGAKFLRHSLTDPRTGRFELDAENGRGAGYLALALLTLLKTGMPVDDPVVEQGFVELGRRRIWQTYQLALAIMAVEAKYAPTHEREALLQGQIELPYERELTPADRALVEEWTAQLLENRDTSVDRAYLSRWSYQPTTSYDHSNTQYALLGLYSAKLCGVKVSDGVWFAAANHLLEAQRPAEGGRRRLPLTGYAEIARLGTGGTSGRRTQRTPPWSEPRSWAYTGHPADVGYASMTAAGISSLTICSAALRRDVQLAREAARSSRSRRARRDAREKEESTNHFLDRIDAAIRDGFAWLHENRSLRYQAGPDLWRRDSHLFYYLYGFERACELSRVARIGGWDWYHDGAWLLMQQQGRSGGIPGNAIKDTCFSLLFLKKAQAPVLTGPR